MADKKKNIGAERRKKTRGRVSSKISRWFVFGVFALFTVSLLVAMGMGAIIVAEWKLDDYGSLLAYTGVILVISLVVGMALAVVYTRIVLNTTMPYVDALQRVGECDFSVRVQDNKFLEEFHLAEHFNNTVEQLASVETLRENFVSDFSHEFKTPIVSIAGFATLLKNPNLTESERNEYLDVIIDESNHLVGLSESVLMLTRLDSQSVVNERYRLDEQLRQCVLMFTKTCAERNIEIEPCLDVQYICGAEKLNRQVWVNLIGNAVKFTPDGGKITVTANCADGEVTVSVADSGVGMDSDTVKHIFDKFYQGDKSHTTPGNGLGLSIVKKIVDLQHGSVTVDSTPGKGSTFTVVLSEDAK